MNSSRPTSFNPRTVIVLIIIGLVLIGGGFLMAATLPIIFPQQASAESQQVDNLFGVLLVIGGAIFLLVQGMLAYSVWRFRARPGDTSDGIYLHGNPTLEIVWTAIPAVIVLLLTILSYQVFVSIQSPKDGEMEVAAVGARFNWAFSYNAPMDIFPDAIDISALPEAVQADINDDGALTVTSPELHSYVGRSVVLSMEPRDVIHSFWVPAFRVKQDLIPGRVTTVRFTPTLANTPGNPYYPIRCAELCGAGHGEMVASAVVHEDEATFNEWLIPLMSEIIYPPADPVERGQGILASNIYPCFTCHVLNIPDAAAPWTGNVGPSLNGIGDRAVGIRSQATGLSGADYLYQSIQDPHTYLVPGYGPLMPPNLVQQDCDIQAIVAYLGTQTESGTPAFEIDTEAYAANCAGASAPDGEATAEATGEATAEATVAAEATEPVATWTPLPEAEATAEATTDAAGEATAEAAP